MRSSRIDGGTAVGDPARFIHALFYSTFEGIQIVARILVFWLKSTRCLKFWSAEKNGREWDEFETCLVGERHISSRARQGL